MSIQNMLILQCKNIAVLMTNDKCQVFMVLSRAVFPGARFTSLDLRGVHLIIQDADYNLCLETIESPSQQVRATVCLRETCLLH